MNTDMLNVLKERRSIRRFKPEQIRDDELAAVLEAATFAPSAMGRQPCVIVAVQNKEDIAQLSTMNAEVMGKSIDPYYGAPTIVLVFSAASGVMPVEDGCAVMTYLLAAAAAAGLGACWINRERQMFDSPEGKALLKKWGLTGDYVGIAGCSLGYIDGKSPDPAPRKDGYTLRIR